MSRQTISLNVSDLSAFAKILRQGLQQLPEPPGHVELLNLLAKAGGFGNFQHLRAMQSAVVAPAPAATAAPDEDTERGLRAANHFDASGMMVSWPSKPSLQTLCLYVLWARLPLDETWNEREFSALLDRWHSFGDAALLRREMWSQGLIHRSPRGTDYRRLAVEPPAVLAPLLARLRITPSG